MQNFLQSLLKGLKFIVSYLFQRFYLSLRELISNKFISLIVLLSIVISVFTLVVFDVVSKNFNNYINKKFASSIPPDMIKISPRPPTSLLFFSFRNSEAGIIDGQTIRRIKRIKGVSKIFPVMSVEVPLQSRIYYMSFRYRTDLLGMGLPYELIKKDIKKKKYRKLWKKPVDGKPIPVIVPRTVLQAYNNGMADQNNLPRFTEDKIIDFSLKLIYGKSSLKTLEGYKTVDANVSGFTDRVNMLALILPIKSVEKMNRKFFGETYHKNYLHLYIKAKNHESMLRLVEKVKKMGYVYEQGKAVSGQIVQLKQRINRIIKYLKYLIVVLALIAISFSTVIATLNRLEYYRIMRIIGSSKIFITFTIAVKYVVLGFIGSYFSIKLIGLLSRHLEGMLSFFGFVVSVSISEEITKQILIYGTLIPLISTLPALLRLYFKGLNRD